MAYHRTSPVCPKCSSARVNRSRRKVLDHLNIFFLPYRCDTCKKRFLVPQKFVRVGMSGLMWVVAVGVIGTIIWIVVNRFAK